MSEETDIFFPETLPFPFSIHSLLRRDGEAIESGQKVLHYSFVSRPADPTKEPETRFGSWDATFSGELKGWNVKVGDTITRERARRRPALRLLEPCKHGIQYYGLCALCGVDMDRIDFSSRGESSRATIQMTHSASGPTVTLEEAQRLERETSERLVKARKLSLIVDLDQTIVHATVDPTVGEWIAEGEDWEERQARRTVKREASTNGDKVSGSDNSDSSNDSEEGDDEVNPNWEALKDVKKFRLPPDNFGAPRDVWRKNKGIQNDGCLYYVKPRPGWKEFLQSVATKYEMHVYTMGTRAYAEEVCAAIDPDGQLFGGRILSRDESGSLTQKSLRRLFPCDTSMVVIIDDRADVWEWSPNLIKVIPYDFFVGIGDINSAFLPKLDPLAASLTLPKPPDDISPGATPPVPVPSSVPSPSTTLSPLSDASEEETPVGSGVEEYSETKDEMISQNTRALEAQVEERPLAKKQEQLDSDDDEPTEPAIDPPDEPDDNVQNHTPSEDHATKHHQHKKALLKNDDEELTRVGRILDEVHTRFYSAYDNKLPENSISKRRKSFVEPAVAYDVKHIVPSIRRETFRGVHILFSGVIPTNLKVEHEATDIWKMATAFGASCHKELTGSVTHVVTSKRGTQKVEKARSMGGIFVVWLQWFTDSVAKWQRQDESKYFLGDARADSPSRDLVSSPPSDPNAISTDTDPEALVGDLDDDESAENAGSEDNTQAPLGDGEEILDLDPEGDLELDEIDWANVNDEVEAAMMESDGDDDDDDDSRSINSAVSEEGSVADEDMGDASRDSLAPRRERKRLRSVTPSDAGDQSDELRSRLAKRKKIAANRSGMSRLKEAVSVHDLEDPADEDTGSKTPNTPGSPIQERSSTNGSMNGDGEESEFGEEIDDDFLARELEAELG